MRPFHKHSVIHQTLSVYIVNTLPSVLAHDVRIPVTRAVYTPLIETHRDSIHRVITSVMDDMATRKEPFDSRACNVVETMI